MKEKTEKKEDSACEEFGDRKHPSHITRFSDASSFDEVCIACGATDQVPGGWGELAKPCSKAKP